MSNNISIIFYLFILLFNYSKQICDENCVQCNNSTNECIKCIPTYANINGQCTSIEDIKAPENCNIKNCDICKTEKECEICKDGFILENKVCYSTKCTQFGFCSYCDEYDCKKCLKNYQLKYGTCDETKYAPIKRLILKIVIPVIIFLIIIALISYNIKNKNKYNIVADKVIKYKHPKRGNYVIILPPGKEENNKNESKLDVSSNAGDNHTSYTSSVDEKAIMNKCVICGKKNIFNYADCYCALCIEHYKSIMNNKNGNKLYCPVHNIPLTKNFFIQLHKKSSLKGNAIDKLSYVLCPICKLFPAKVSFNCGCKAKVCDKCFNDNIYIYKYKTCPLCGNPYNSFKHKIIKKIIVKNIGSERNEKLD